MKRFEAAYITAYWTAAAVLALVWLAYRLPACGHICLTMVLVAGGVWAVRQLAEMDRRFKRQRRRRRP
jgi:4-hydroxybenzoate polyprenyltransferase